MIEIDAGFPGGSVMVEDVDEARGRIRFAPGHHPGRGWQAWYYFRVRGLDPATAPVRLELARHDWKWLSRAHFSLDDRSWAQTEPGQATDGYMRYEVEAASNELWFAWGVPYLPRHADQLARDALEEGPPVQSFELCRSTEGRPVQGLRLGATGSDEPLGIWVQARQHAWEASASWVCDELVRWLLSTDPRARRVRSLAEIHVVPIMDVDNVVRGAGGKGEDPRDHARDWDAAPHWPAVAAVQGRIRALASEGRFDVFLDIHGPGREAPFFFTRPREMLPPVAAERLERFQRVANVRPWSDKVARGDRSPSTDLYYEEKVPGRLGPHDFCFAARIPPGVGAVEWLYGEVTSTALALVLETVADTPLASAAGLRRQAEAIGVALGRYLDDVTRPS